jgi:NifU-like protein involved in Fe-S cluster formation
VCVYILHQRPGKEVFRHATHTKSSCGILLASSEDLILETVKKQHLKELQQRKALMF